MENKANCDCLVYTDREQFRIDREKGSVYFTARDNDGEQFMWYFCPCGCDRLSVVSCGKGFKPKESPSWKWDGDERAPTLKPSLNLVDHWHGFLTAGKWISV